MKVFAFGQSAVGMGIGMPSIFLARCHLSAVETFSEICGLVTMLGTLSV
jgi:hypothetical protein